MPLLAIRIPPISRPCMTAEIVHDLIGVSVFMSGGDGLRSAEPRVPAISRGPLAKKMIQ